MCIRDSAITVDQSLDYFQLQIGRTEAVIVFFIDMNNKFWSEPTDSHPCDLAVRYFSFNSLEQTHEGVIGQDIVEVAVGKQENALLFFVDMVYFDQFARQDDRF